MTGVKLVKWALNFRLLSVPTLSTHGSSVGVRRMSLSHRQGPPQGRLGHHPLPLLLQPARSTSFFNKVSADQLWKGVTSVSNAGRKKGRGKGMGKKFSKDLNRGQVIGVGEENMVWPGLNTPILRGRELVQQQQLPRDEERQARLVQVRDSMGKLRRRKADPMERGWTGTKMGGRSVGPPDPVGEDTFEGFDSHVLEFKIVTCMTAVFGRRRQFSLLVVTGNGDGLAGFALAKGTTIPAVTRKAKNCAAQKLLYVPRYQGHTVLHDFYSQFGATKVFVSQRPRGYGLCCHRVLRTICNAIGITDLHAKVEGSGNIQNLVKAFFIGLMQQKTAQDLSEEKRLHLVEFRRERLDYPVVLASPCLAPVRTPDQIPRTEDLDVSRYMMGGRVRLERKKYPPGYERLPSFQLHLKRYATRRNQEKVKVEMLQREGEYRSFLADQYPECRLPRPRHPARPALP